MFLNVFERRNYEFMNSSLAVRWVEHWGVWTCYCYCVDTGQWNVWNWRYSMIYQGPAVSLTFFALKDLWFSQVRRTEY